MLREAWPASEQLKFLSSNKTMEKATCNVLVCHFNDTSTRVSLQ